MCTHTQKNMPHAHRRTCQLSVLNIIGLHNFLEWKGLCMHQKYEFQQLFSRVTTACFLDGCVPFKLYIYDLYIYQFCAPYMLFLNFVMHAYGIDYPQTLNLLEVLQHILLQQFTLILEYKQEPCLNIDFLFLVKEIYNKWALVLFLVSLFDCIPSRVLRIWLFITGTAAEAKVNKLEIT